ncbi:hypothetical protein ACPPVO_05450 [Dactylosporangium sp. McL0621]|uniref:hypothetical protein n=1 Tax=Dactylosporangium sp. McL0621 TaxID=3415678 RepID=UPI003CF16F7A
MAQRLRVLAPSGQQVDIGLADGPKAGSVGTHIRFAGGSLARGFQIGPRGYHKFAGTYVVPASTVDRFIVHGREVVVSRQENGAGAVATLMGDYHELMTVFGGPAPRREVVINLFSALEIEDHPEGMLVRPTSSMLLDSVLEQIVVSVAGRGTVNTMSPQQARSVLPVHQGQATRYGEVWRGARPGVQSPSALTDYTYLMGFPRGFGEVHFAPGAGVTDDALLAWLDEVQVEWADAPGAAPAGK